MTFAELIRAPALHLAPGFPNEIAIVLGEQVAAAAAIADLPEHLMPSALLAAVGSTRQPRVSRRASPRRASESLLYKVQGCTETNTGFDGVSYTPVWPDGNTALHSTPIRFTSAVTGSGYDQPYDRAAFEADLPRIEFSTRNRTTGAGCTLIPTADDNGPGA